MVPHAGAESGGELLLAAALRLPLELVEGDSAVVTKRIEAPANALGTAREGSVVSAEAEAKGIIELEEGGDAEGLAGEGGERDHGGQTEGGVDEFASKVGEGKIGIGILFADFDAEVVLEGEMFVPVFGDGGEVGAIGCADG